MSANGGDPFRDDMTLAAARDELRRLIMRSTAGEAPDCPCCTQKAAIYKRKLNARMAIAAIKLYRAGAMHEFVHLATVAGDGCEGGKLRYWGLLVEERERRSDGGRSGWWHMTHAGERFVLNLEPVPKYAHIYDGRCLRLAGELVVIVDCLGEKFNYDELMSQ